MNRDMSSDIRKQMNDAGDDSNASTRTREMVRGVGAFVSMYFVRIQTQL